MLREVHLGGALGKTYGALHHFDISTPTEAFRALDANFPGFLDEMHRMSGEGYVYRVAHGRDFGIDVRDTTELHYPVSGPLLIMPEIAGAKNPVEQLLTAAAIITAAIVAPEYLVTAGMSEGTAAAVGSTLMNIGVAMALGSVIQMLSPQQSEKPKDEQAPSYVFGGPINTMAQGHPVPVGYGEMIVGSAVISASIDVEEVPFVATPAPGTTPPTYVDSGGATVAYPAPTLVWDDSIKNWRLAGDGSPLLFDDVWNAATEQMTRSNYRTADARVPTLGTNPQIWGIANPGTNVATAGIGPTGLYQWKMNGIVGLRLDGANQRWTVDNQDIFAI